MENTGKHEGIPVTGKMFYTKSGEYFSYRIRPNYRTVRLGFSKLQGTLGCGKIRIYLLRIYY